MDSRAIVRGFSRAADTYDDYATAQRIAGEKLIETTRRFVADAGLEPARILDVGCGTGMYTRLLANTYPAAAITAVDPSESMLAIARGQAAPSVEYRVGWAPEGGDWFDLITSNGALQWSPDLAGAVSGFRARLRPYGLLTCGLFGSGTYSELSSALTSAAGRDVSLPANRFPDRETLRALLAMAFASVHVEEFEINLQFESVRDLLASIKKTGVRGAGSSPSLRWTRQFMARIEDAYRTEQGEINATYHFLIGLACVGVSPRTGVLFNSKGK
jgi:malonyl-CoA O-methyltransferase